MPQKLLNQAQLLSIYIGESDRWRGKPLYAAILEALKREGMAGATVTRGVAGFGAHSRIHTAAILRLSEDLPVIIQVVDSPEHIRRAIEVVAPMVREGLITLQDVQVMRYTHRYLNPLPADRLVKEVMTHEVQTLAAHMSVAEAWQKMLDTLIKAMPVVSEDGRVQGMVTDEDLLERAGLQQRLSVAERLEASLLEEEIKRLRQSPLTVADVMTTPAITIRLDEPVGVAVTRMAKEGIKRLPVVDAQGRLVGILSRVDILRLLAEKPVGHPLPPPGAAKTVREVMSSAIPAVQAEDGLAEIVETFLESGTHRIIVLGEDGRAIGLISDSDVVGRIQPEQRRGVLKALFARSETPSSKVTAADLMSPGVLTAPPDLPLPEAARLMLSTRRKWLVVVDENGLPLGLVDRHILLRALSGS
jgi:CBS-domain-containing membrane protein